MGCIDDCSNENIPDETYDFLIKQKEPKDGLEVYKPKSTISYVSQIRCPLCKCRISTEEKTIIQDIFNMGNESKLLALIENYNREVDNDDEIDDIDELEYLYSKIKDMAEIVESNRFYKHTCTKNEICKRTSNQEIYIDLCLYSPKNKIKNGIKLDFNKLKNDDIYRNNYLNAKKILYEKKLKREKRKQIENAYIYEFEEITFKLERDKFELAKQKILIEYENYLRGQSINSPYNVRFEFDASLEWFKEKRNLIYTSSKKKLLKFIEKLTGQTIYDNLNMPDDEFFLFQKFIIERDPEYYELLDY